MKTEGGKMLVLGQNVPFSIRGMCIQVVSVYPSKFLHLLLSKKKEAMLIPVLNEGLPCFPFSTGNPRTVFKMSLDMVVTCLKWE